MNSVVTHLVHSQAHVYSAVLGFELITSQGRRIAFRVLLVLIQKVSPISAQVALEVLKVKWVSIPNF